MNINIISSENSYATITFIESEVFKDGYVNR
ncbi:hypothetical protein Cmaq_1275 [Caldivirga maquilingensis IC-167]|uniref:Uncharacterized protein n=1 Tax=Caldivirga maquilingensis (strain ATCC 700844 / DSM 13496 / JCM 10307 / IC-167) TaxID=397948 RepID=A8ME96_CALMQ|nr:hypothetical protein Cmaq_1275 [Caldivirga maquilingensis IC-167]